jgi:hypothetical protein
VIRLYASAIVADPMIASMRATVSPIPTSPDLRQFDNHRASQGQLSGSVTG